MQRWKRHSKILAEKFSTRYVNGAISFHGCGHRVLVIITGQCPHIHRGPSVTSAE